jgi:hypothetical protein
MFSKTKETLFALFSFSLLEGYVASFGYFNFFHLDISSFLTTEDLIFIFARWIWLTSFISLLGIYFVNNAFNSLSKPANSNRWRNRTFSKYKIKNGIFIYLPSIFLFLFIMIYYRPFRDGFFAVVGFCMILVFIIGLLLSSVEKLKQVGDPMKLTIKDWVLICGTASIFIYLVPFVGGTMAAQSSGRSDIRIVFDDSTVLNTKDSTDLLYIGKTHNYLFLFKPSTQKSSAYRIEKVKYLEITDVK